MTYARIGGSLVRRIVDASVKIPDRKATEAREFYGLMAKSRNTRLVENPSAKEGLRLYSDIRHELPG